MPRYSLRTLLICMAIGPPAIALEWWYWKESPFALLVLIVVSLYSFLGLLYLILLVLELIYDTLCQLISVKPRRVPADDSN